MRLAALPCIVRDVEPVALVLTGVRGLVSWGGFSSYYWCSGGWGGGVVASARYLQCSVVRHNFGKQGVAGNI